MSKTPGRAERSPRAILGAETEGHTHLGKKKVLVGGETSMGGRIPGFQSRTILILGLQDVPPDP